MIGRAVHRKPARGRCVVGARGAGTRCAGGHRSAERRGRSRSRADAAPRAVRHGHRARLRDDESGSALPLALGYVLLALAVILVVANATSLHIAQKRLDALADAAALAGADGFRIELVDDRPTAALTDDAVAEQARAIVAAAGDGAVLVEAGTPDGVSARVIVAETWRPILVSAFVPARVELTATATSRTALN